MKILETKHFTVKYADYDKDILSVITDLIEDTYKSIITEFELNDDENRFEFILCPDVMTFMKETDENPDTYQEWMVGSADYMKRKVCVLSPKSVTDRSYEDMLAVIQHEIVHIAFEQLQNADDGDIMISEGIAVAYANQINIPLLNEEEYPDIRRLSDENYFYENDGYNYSGVYVLHLIKKYGIDVFKRIYAGEEDLDKYLYDGFERNAIHQVACYRLGR